MNDWPIVLKKTLAFIFKIYSPKIIVLNLLIFIIIFNQPLRIVPDYFNLGEIENLRTFIWGLFTITISFSGLILTVLLVTYNFYLKTTRRNTFEFIIENPWLKIILSFFGSNILLNILGFCFINPNHPNLTVLYFLLIITTVYIISVFPIAILSLKYSTSISRIEKELKNVKPSDIEYLYSPSKFLEMHPFEDMEKNKIVLLKDIGVNAIKDNDWILPQKILSGIADIVNNTIKTDRDEINKVAFSFLFLCRHFKRVALKNSDSILVNVLYRQGTVLYSQIFKNKVQQFDLRNLDEYFQEFCFNIISSNDYPEIRGGMLQDIINIIKESLESIRYTDEELPTNAYRFSSDRRDDVESNQEAYQFWHYLVHTQIEMLVNIIKHSILQRDERVYDHFNWPIHSLLSTVMKLENLTDYQKQSYIDDVYYVLDELTEYAINNGVFENIEIFSQVQIEVWIKQKKKRLYEQGLFHYSKLLKRLSAKQKISSYHLDDFFMIARVMAAQDINQREKEDIVDYILDTGIKLFEKRYDSQRLKYDLQHQLHWLLSYLNEHNSLLSLKEKYGGKILDITHDYRYDNFPD